MTSHHTDQERAEFEAWSQANNKYHVSGYNPHNDLWEAWQAARSAPAAPEPQGWKLVPVNLLKRIQESLGSFVSDQGRSQSDMDTADALNGLLARDSIEDTDPDDALFDDFAEDVDDSECVSCSGTGEGIFDGHSCVVCRGKGFL